MYSLDSRLNIFIILFYPEWQGIKKRKSKNAQKSLFYVKCVCLWLSLISFLFLFYFLVIPITYYLFINLINKYTGIE